MRHGPPRQISVARPFFEVLSRAAPTLSGLLEYQGVFSDTLGPPLCLYRVPPPQNIRPDEPCESVGTTARSPAAVPVVESTSPTPSGNRSAAASGTPLVAPCVVAQFSSAAVHRCRAVDSAQPLARRGYPGRTACRPCAAGCACRLPSHHRSLLRPSKTAGSAATASKVPARCIWSLSIESSRGRAEWRPPAPEANAVQRAHPSVSPHPCRGGHAAAEKSAPRPRQEQDRIKHRNRRRWCWRSSLGDEVYVDGKKVGITPPLKRFEVAPGRRQITITNSFLPSYQMEATLDPKEQITVTHDFSCVSHREKPCRDEFGRGSSCGRVSSQSSAGSQR